MRTLPVRPSRKSRGRLRGIAARILALACASAGATAAALPPEALASKPAIRKIQVRLFNQPCLLQGPVDERTLQLIHSLSPEQIYPKNEDPLAPEPTRRALDKLRASGAPDALDLYRERLMKRWEAQLLLLNAIENYRKTRKAEPIRSAGKKQLKGRRLAAFEAQAKKLGEVREPGSRKAGEILESAFEAYSDGIEPDPEEEFHRAIRRMDVQYACSLDDNAKGDGSGDPGAED